MAKISNIDREGFEIIDAGLQEDLAHNRVLIEKRIRAKYTDKVTQRNENNNNLRSNAERFPDEEDKQYIKDISEEEITRRDDALEAEIQAEIARENEEARQYLESRAFEEYGGSRESALGELEKKERLQREQLDEFKKASNQQEAIKQQKRQEVLRDFEKASIHNSPNEGKGNRGTNKGLNPPKVERDVSN